jgi:putative membrane protein
MTPDPAGPAPDEIVTGGDHAGDLAERRLHPAYLVISFARTVRALIPLIAVGIWKAQGWMIYALAGLIALRSVAEWWMRKYSVTDGSFRLRSGLLKRTQDTIGLARITSVDAERGVVQRLLGVWGVKIRTPGNDHRSSVHLACLSASALETLRVALRPVADPAASAPVTAAAPGETLAVLDTRTLLLAAITGTSVPLILAGAAATFGRARDLLPDRVFDHLAHRVFVGGTTTALLLLAAALLAVLAGIALTSLRLAGFTLVRETDRLRITRGLIAQRSGTIPVDRVQAIRMVEGWWRRMLGYCALEVEVAGLSTSNDTERMLFPMIRTQLAVGLVNRALPELQWRPAPLREMPPSVRRRYFTLPLLLGIVSTVALALLPGWGAYLALVPLPVAALVGWGQAADAAWHLDEDTVTLRWRRVLARHTVVARRRRVQLTQTSRTRLQRRAGLSGVRLLLSSRRKARLRHLPASQGAMLLHAIGRRPLPVPAISVASGLQSADG